MEHINLTLYTKKLSSVCMVHGRHAHLDTQFHDCMLKVSFSYSVFFAGSITGLLKYLPEGVWWHQLSSHQRCFIHLRSTTLNTIWQSTFKTSLHHCGSKVSGIMCHRLNCKTMVYTQRLKQLLNDQDKVNLKM